MAGKRRITHRSVAVRQRLHDQGAVREFAQLQLSANLWELLDRLRDIQPVSDVPRLPLLLPQSYHDPVGRIMHAIDYGGGSE